MAASLLGLISGVWTVVTITVFWGVVSLVTKGVGQLTEQLSNPSAAIFLALVAFVPGAILGSVVLRSKLPRSVLARYGLLVLMGAVIVPLSLSLTVLIGGMYVMPSHELLSLAGVSKLFSSVLIATLFMMAADVIGAYGTLSLVPGVLAILTMYWATPWVMNLTRRCSGRG